MHVYVPAALGDDLGFHDVHVRRLRVDVVAVEPPANVERVGIPSHHLFDPMCEESGVCIHRLEDKKQCGPTFDNT